MSSNKKNNFDKNFFIKNFLLILAVILITVIPILFVSNAEFAGADDKAKGVITELDKNYEPWFNVIWEPPSSEVASLLFALQAAIGSAFIGYYIGFIQGKRVNKNDLH